MQLFPSETEPLQRARHERLHDDVELRDELLQQRPALLRLQVQRDVSLVACVDLPPQWLAVAGPLAQRVTDTRLLDLDDVGAEIGEQHAGDTAGDHAGQIEDADTFQGSHEISSLYMYG